jgi:hypothetical protein
MTLSQEIEAAFSEVTFPGANQLVDSKTHEGQAVASAFKDCTDWRSLDAEFLNSAPDGLGSALNFFSAKAFQFYLPAYLLADLQGKLSFVEPDYSLCYSHSDSWDGCIDNDDRYAAFTKSQCEVIVKYLKARLKRREDPMIAKSLNLYWMKRIE